MTKNEEYKIEILITNATKLIDDSKLRQKDKPEYANACLEQAVSRLNDVYKILKEQESDSEEERRAKEFKDNDSPFISDPARNFGGSGVGCDPAVSREETIRNLGTPMANEEGFCSSGNPFKRGTPSYNKFKEQAKTK